MISFNPGELVIVELSGRNLHGVVDCPCGSGFYLIQVKDDALASVIVGEHRLRHVEPFFTSPGDGE